MFLDFFETGSNIKCKKCFKIDFILALITNIVVVNAVTSFLALETLHTCKYSVFLY